MWAMAAAVFFGCKWLTLLRAQERLPRVSRKRAAAYLLAWPGMDAERFLTATQGTRPHFEEVALASGRLALGAVLLFGLARLIPQPQLAGWIGMVGMVLLLHFGAFHLLSVWWRWIGVDAPPIMNAPLRSTSVGEFWSRRWNGAFNQLALQLVFRPLARRTGTTTATLVAFLVSGLVHELVISLPAGAGYGLPTGYFLMQGAALLVEHRLGMRSWVFTMLVVAAPAYWLFHPLFVERVILPFMRTIGAL
jgi:alginate O-acetyltransferase complex protein AlgI